MLVDCCWRSANKTLNRWAPVAFRRDFRFHLADIPHFRPCCKKKFPPIHNHLLSRAMSTTETVKASISVLLSPQGRVSQTNKTSDLPGFLEISKGAQSAWSRSHAMPPVTSLSLLLRRRSARTVWSSDPPPVCKERLNYTERVMT